MRLCVIQMDMRLSESAYNFAHAEALLRRAAAEGADTALLPETWNTGFFPADHLPERSDRGAALLPLHFVVSIPMKIKEL